MEEALLVSASTTTARESSVADRHKDIRETLNTYADL
jgi:hypothetical protein